MRLFSLFIVITGSIVTSFIAIVFLLTFLSDDTQRSSFSHTIYLDKESGKMYFPVVNKLMRNLNEIFNVDYTADDLSNEYKQKLLECFFYMNELKIEPTESNRIHYLKSCEPKFQTKP